MDRERIAYIVEQEMSRCFANTSLIEFLRGDAWAKTTKMVKGCLGTLGHTHEFQVAASGFPGADEGEWLYDMVWFKLENGYLTRQALVVESELNPDPTIDGDFQKLVQARAEVRVWISCSPNADLAQQHVANCKRQASLFHGSMNGDTYIFVTDNWTHPKAVVERFIVALPPSLP